MTRVISNSADETFRCGRTFAAALHPGDVVALRGALGSGKTRFIAGVCEGLGVTAHVTSPTFTLINEYPAPFGMVAHCDMYRITQRREVAELGIEEYFNDRCICMIEWPEAIADFLPPDTLHVSIAHGRAEGEREIVIAERREVPL